MYVGTKKIAGQYKYQLPKKEEVITTEEVLVNGIICQQIKRKIQDIKSDTNISYRDFDIKALQLINAVNQLVPSQLTRSINEVQEAAETANQVLDYYTMINQQKHQNNEQQQTQQQAQQEINEN